MTNIIYYYSGRYFLPFKTNTTKIFVRFKNNPCKNVNYNTFENTKYYNRSQSLLENIINIEIKNKNILERLYARFKKQ